MRKLIIFTLLILSCTVSAVGEELKIGTVSKKESAETVPGEILIEIEKGIIDLRGEKGRVSSDRAGVNSKPLAALNKRYDLKSIEKLFSGTRSDRPSDIYVFRFSPKVNVNKLISDYKKDGNVIYAEPNYAVHIE